MRRGRTRHPRPAQSRHRSHEAASRRVTSGRGQFVRTTTRRSAPDSGAHTSPGRPRICRTLAPRRGLGYDSKRSVFGSKLTSALAPQSLSHTTSRSSTYTAYTFGLAPGRRHARHALAAGSYTLTCPEFHSLTHTRFFESPHTRRAPCFGVGGSMTVACPLSTSMRAIWLPASDA